MKSAFTVRGCVAGLPLRGYAASVLVALHAAAHAADSTVVAGTAQAAPVAASQPGTVGSVFQVLPGLALVLLLIVACAWVAKRFNGARMSGNATIKFVASQSLSARERVVIVEVNQQWLVLGVAPGRVSQLTQMPRPETTADATPQFARPPFAVWLEKALAKK